MKFVLFYHSLVSDWNHGNAHFLRGVASELLSRGHQVQVYEPAAGWSLQNLLRDEGPAAVEGFQKAYPQLHAAFYRPETLNLDEALDDANVVLVHEWNEPELVARLGQHRSQGGNYQLLFHDTHHRSVTAVDQMRSYPLQHYDGVLAFGDVIRDVYLKNGWVRQAWTWHEAADTRLFRPASADARSQTPSTKPSQQDLVWIGNWGDEERSQELLQYLISPATKLRLRTSVHGVRYPRTALRTLQSAGIGYQGWLANHRVPQVFHDSGFTVHIPRRPYRQQLPGVPTIRVFEALACGIPLICLRWHDSENLFSPGQDYLVVDTPTAMQQAMRALQHDTDLREHLSKNGFHTIQKRHTCAHRVDQLLQIVAPAGRPASLKELPTLTVRG